MSTIIKIALALVAALMSALLLRKINIKRDFRMRQIPITYVSPFIGIAGIIAGYVFYDKYAGSETVSSFYEQLPEAGTEVASSSSVIVVNIVILLVFLVIKLIMMPIVKSALKKNEQIELTSGSWYEYDEDYKLWFLKDRFRNLRSMFSVLSWIITVACAAVFILSVSFSEESGWWVKAFPIGALIVVTEIYNFLNGYTKAEYLYDVGGEGIRSSRVGVYYKLRKIYEDLFPSAILVSHTDNSYSGKVGATEAIRRLEGSEDETERIVGSYFSSLKKKNGLFDVDLVSATNALLHGESSVIFNPFYRDLSDYLLLPIVNSLINDKKCLIIVGRGDIASDISDWVCGILKKYSRTRSLFRTAMLDRNTPECEVGIMSFSQIYDDEVLNANSEFFGNTGFVIFIEPSRMLATSQSGLGIIAEKFNKASKPTCCICDRDVDGLVDVMSHVLQINLTNVVAAPVNRNSSTYIGWAAAGDLLRQKLFDKQTHYLGNGTEIAAVAVKNQIPHVTWYGAEKAPVRDIHWIAGQYYPQICKYSNLPSQQKSLDEHISFSSNLWGSEVKKEEFLIVEDEFCNMFSMFRTYLSRGESQSFVNVISENYLLRDYMRYNRQLFMSDPKAISAVAPYYAKTERNTVIKIILMMACSPVEESYIIHELKMLGYEVDDAYKILSDLIYKYTFVADTIITAQTHQSLNDDLVPIQSTCYSISKQVFEDNFASTLKNAFFVVEDEKFDTQRIDAKLFGHITQTVMPGQYITYNGKYYRVSSVSPQIGCILHRAADSYTRRVYYKQIRHYNFQSGEELISSKRITDVEVSFVRRSFSVDTTGYLQMLDNHDLRTSQEIDLSGDPNIKAFNRSYKNKTVLKIRLPDTDASVRFTISMLLNEIFRTVFPDSWMYLGVLSPYPDDVEGILRKFNYGIDGDIEDDMIYVVEDSDMDLGLLEAVENNLIHFFEIMSDYLNWHFEKMKEPPAKDPVPEVEIPDEKEKKRISLRARFNRLINRILGRHGEDEPEKKDGGKKKKDTPEKKPSDDQKPEAKGKEADESPFEEDEKKDTPEEESIVETSSSGEDAPIEDEKSEAEDSGSEEKANQDTSDIVTPAEEQIALHTDGEDLFGTDGVPDDLDILLPIEPTRYQKECFLKFGFAEIDSRLAIEDVSSYLTVRGWSNGDLAKARKREAFDGDMLDMDAVNCCDFCGVPLTGVSYDRLADGRIRCNDCSMTAINTVAEFRELFNHTEAMMEDTYGIHIPVSITVRTADARTIGKQSGMIFRPSAQFAGRVLGFAQHKGGKYSLLIENGSPRLASVDTITHELTHIWQYINWDDNKIRRYYSMPRRECTARARLIVYEGMAVWSAIQMLYSMGETSYAEKQEAIMLSRNDEYGVGFRLYRDRYGIERNGDDPTFTPFASFPPLEIEDVRAASKALCPRGSRCRC
ncbi:MAG: hypothetical protein LUG86_00245 [Oscillospiraceae bacterium]|nr:hypothetical protein [Oscillospiraceae bacterium]